MNVTLLKKNSAVRSAKRDEVKAVMLQQQSETFNGDKSDCTNMPEV